MGRMLEYILYQIYRSGAEWGGVSKARSSFVWKQCSAQLPSTFLPPMASERRFLRRYIMWEAKRRGH